MLTLSGNTELMAKLSSLPVRVRQAALQTAMRQLAERAAQRLQTAAPFHTGALKRSLKHSIRTYKSGRIVFGIAGVDLHHIEYDKKASGKRPAGDGSNTQRPAGDGRSRVRPSKYVHLPELGTKDRVTKTGANRGSVQGLHFIGDTQKEMTSQAETLLTAAIQKELS